MHYICLLTLVIVIKIVIAKIYVMATTVVSTLGNHHSFHFP